MSPFNCLLFVGFLFSLQTISARVVQNESNLGDEPQVPGGYSSVSPTSENILVAFQAIKPLIIVHLYEHYPMYASGTIQPPFAAFQKIVSHAAHYRISFLVTPANSLSTGNFTVQIDKQLNYNDNHIKFALNELVLVNESDLIDQRPTTNFPILQQKDEKSGELDDLIITDRNRAVYHYKNGTYSVRE